MTKEELIQQAKELNKEVSWAQNHLPALNRLVEVVISRAYQAGVEAGKKIGMDSHIDVKGNSKLIGRANCNIRENDFVYWGDIENPKS